MRQAGEGKSEAQPFKEFVAIFLDGLGFGGVLVVAAMGVTLQRVKRWRNGKGQRVLHWTGAAALETERRFRKVSGQKLLAVLVSALKGSPSSVDAIKEVG